MIKLFGYGYFFAACVVGMATVFGNEVHATTFYVDSLLGNDVAAGTTAATPWRSVNRVNRQTFQVGDVILFQRGRSWYDVSLKVATSLTIGAYGEGVRPRLIGSVLHTQWAGENGKMCTDFKHDWDVQLVKDYQRGYYKKVLTSLADVVAGSFFYDKPSQKICLIPYDGRDPRTVTMLIGNRNHIIELQQVKGINLEVRDMELSYANRFAISPWWQGGAVSYGSVVIENCEFIGNAFSAIALSGSATYDRVLIANNRIIENGAEGIYIGVNAVSNQIDIVDNRIGDANDVWFGWRGEGVASAFNGDGIDVKHGNRRVSILRNKVTNVDGLGVTTQSGGSILTDNIVINAHLAGALTACLSADVQGRDADLQTIISRNRIYGSKCNGIVLRGDAVLAPPVRVEDNEISLIGNYGAAQINLESMNNANMTIRNNRGEGGAYGLYVYGMPPQNMRVENNKFYGVERALYIMPNKLEGMSLVGNEVCETTSIIIEWRNGELVTDLTAALKRLNASGGIRRIQCLPPGAPGRVRVQGTGAP